MYLPGLALPLLAAIIPANWQVKIINELIEDVDFDESCDIVGLGTMGHSVVRALDMAKEFKKRNRIVIMGGMAASYLPGHMLGDIDSLVKGPGEISLPQLLKDFETTGKLKKEYSNFLENLSELPVPRYELMPLKKIPNMLPVQASRGCPNKCDFCCTADFYKGRYMTRNVDDVIADIKKIKELGYRRFFLLDDNIGGNLKFLNDLVKGISSMKVKWSAQCTINLANDENILQAMAGSGCRILSTGVESMTQEGLNGLNKSWLKVKDSAALLKKIRKNGMAVFSSFLIGTDNDTEESLRETVDFILRNKLSIPVFNILTPLPGTALYNKLKSESRLLHENISLYNGFNCVHEPLLISSKRVNEIYWQMYDEVYSVKNILKRNLQTVHFLTNPLLSLFSIYINFQYRRSIRKRIGPLII